MGRRKQPRPIKIESNLVGDIEQPTTSTKEMKPLPINGISENTQSRKRRLSPEISDKPMNLEIKKGNKELDGLTGQKDLIGNPLEALEKALLKIRPQQNSLVNEKSRTNQALNITASSPMSVNTSMFGSSSDGLCSLYKFVASISQSERISPKNPQEEACSILRCLECGEGFAQMEYLVAHMTKTRHFAPLTQRASASHPTNQQGWSPALLTPSTKKSTQHRTNTSSPKMSATNEKPRNGDSTKSAKINPPSLSKEFSPTIFSNLLPPGIGLACSHCGETSENIGYHLKTEHLVEILNLSDWLTHIRMVTVAPKKGSSVETINPKVVPSSPHLNSLMHMIDSVNHTT